MEKIGRSLVLFIVAGLCEIGGGWLMWQWPEATKGARGGCVEPREHRCPRLELRC